MLGPGQDQTRDAKAIGRGFEQRCRVRRRALLREFHAPEVPARGGGIIGDGCTAA